MSSAGSSKMVSPLSPKAPYSEMEVRPEDEEIFLNFKKCIELRDAYMSASCQCVGDNPKDDASFFANPPVLQGTGESMSASMAKLSLSGEKSLSNEYREGNGSEVSLTHSQTSQSINVGKTYHLASYDMESCVIPGPLPHVFKQCEDGVYRFYHSAEDEKEMHPVISLKKYYQDLDYLVGVVMDGPMKSFAYKRLKYLESLFNMYVLLNAANETKEQKTVKHRDFYNVRKVDTHVHHSSCMNQKYLLRFIKSKLRKCGKDVVIFRDGKHLTLEQVFESLNLTTYDLSIDTLDMHAHQQSFHRFDIFNLKYNPIGESRLREIFLKTDNYIKGAYLSELTKEVISDMEASRYQMAEYRVSIYGRSIDEWDKLASWVCDNQLFSNSVRWIIQIPRLYDLYFVNKYVANFQDYIRNIFEPLFEVSRDPSSHPKLHVFLQRVIGFDTVDDESKPERRVHKKFPLPKDWNTRYNPPYSYYLYYIFANMSSLNFYRKERNFNTFVFRPHSGEAGDTEHLAAAYLTSQGISHGILLRKVPALQYLYYLQQIGIAMSPLSNNALFLNFERNPFPMYFRIGMNVSLSTDDPLQFHYTKEPLIEEYSVAAQIWKLSSADLCEISRNSVLQSGFELNAKKQWLGEHVEKVPLPEGNDIKKSNVPNIRVKFRYDTLMRERQWILNLGRFHELQMEDPIINHMALPPLDVSVQVLNQDKDEEDEVIE